MATNNENKQFSEHMFSTYPLDNAIDWIGSNLEPDDIFAEKKLEEWALRNGFVKE